MAKTFDPSKPHKHQCPECWKDVYCANLKCELPQWAECLECKRGEKFETRQGQPAYYGKKPQRFEGDNETRYL